MGHNSAVSGCPISTSFPQVDEWSTDSRVLGRHRITWIKPPRGWMKLNMDGDFHIGRRISKAGVLRND